MEADGHAVTGCGTLGPSPAAGRRAVGAVLETASALVAACRKTCAESARIQARSSELTGRHRNPRPDGVEESPEVIPG